MWIFRVLYVPTRDVWMSCMLWYSPWVKCVMWVCSSSACPEGSGHAEVSIWVWECVNEVNSSGDKVKKACCHIARIGLSVVVVGWKGVLEELLGISHGGEVWHEGWWLTAPSYIVLFVRCWKF